MSTFRCARLAALSACLLLASESIRAGAFVGVSLKIPAESAPPGAMAQMKVFVTEPKPISTGRGFIDTTGLATVGGIALTGDASGVTVFDGPRVAISIVSPSGSFGLNADYPVLTVTGRVSASAPIGTWFPFSLDATSLSLLDPTGALYPLEVTSRGLTVAPGVSIDDVKPGSGFVPAGGTVSIFGTNFQPGTQIRLKDIVVAATNYVSDTRIDVVLGQDAYMRGAQIQARNPDKTADTYYAYERTTRLGASTDQLLNVTVPVFSPAETTSASVVLTGARAAIALQNIESASADVTASLYTADGALLATTVVSLPPDTYIVRDMLDLFGIPNTASNVVRIRATGLVQAMGVAFDPAGAATPLLPR